MMNMNSFLGINNNLAAYNAQNAFPKRSHLAPLERLELQKKDVEFKLQVAQDEMKAIDEAIRVLNDNPTTTLVLNVLSKLGIVS